MRSYGKFLNTYKCLKFYKFHKFGNFLIANDGAKDEFVMVSNWHFYFQKTRLCFGVFTLCDLHEMYWLFKFNRFFKWKLSLMQ